MKAGSLTAEGVKHYTLIATGNEDEAAKAFAHAKLAEWAAKDGF